MFRNILLENWNALVCEITMQLFLNNIDSTLIKM